MRIHIHVSIHICMHRYMHTSVYLCIHIYNTDIYAHMYACTRSRDSSTLRLGNRIPGTSLRLGCAEVDTPSFGSTFTLDVR